MKIVSTQWVYLFVALINRIKFDVLTSRNLCVNCQSADHHFQKFSLHSLHTNYSTCIRLFWPHIMFHIHCFVYRDAACWWFLAGLVASTRFRPCGFASISFFSFFFFNWFGKIWCVHYCTCSGYLSIDIINFRSILISLLNVHHALMHKWIAR